MVGHGVHVRLERAAHDHPTVLRLPGAADAGRRVLRSPGGSVVEVGPVEDELTLPPNRPTLTVSHAAADDDRAVGRAGMRYRDLLPDRWGGRFIASHITIPSGGDVADWVHHHRIRFQVIYSTITQQFECQVEELP